MQQLFIVRTETQIDSVTLDEEPLFELDKVVHKIEVSKGQAMYLYNSKFDYWLELNIGKHTNKVFSLVIRSEYVPKLVRMRQLLER